MGNEKGIERMLVPNGPMIPSCVIWIWLFQLAPHQTRMQSLNARVETEAGKVGLRTNAGKCKIMVSNCWENGPTATDTVRRGLAVEVSDDFCYLTSYILHIGNGNRVCLTKIFGRLKNLWKSKNISLGIKVKLYESIVMSSMIYSAELLYISRTLFRGLSENITTCHKRRKGILWATFFRKQCGQTSN